MADYGYKSFLEEQKNGDVFTPTVDSNSSRWDDLNTPSSSTQQPQQDVPQYTPPVNNATPTITPQTDDPADKQRADLIQARIDIANAPRTSLQEDTESTYTSKQTGYTYDKPKESHGNDAYLGVMGYLAGYLRNMDVGEGMDGAFSAVQQNQDRVDRFKDIGYYEAKGYNPADIDRYYKTGKDDRLVANKTQWQSAGGGYIFNSATGDFKTANGTTTNKQVDKTVDLGDKQRVYYKDGTSEDLPKGMTPQQGQNVRTVDLGDRIETYDANNNLISSQPKGATPTATGGTGGVQAQKQAQANAQLTKTIDTNNGRIDDIQERIKNTDAAAFRPLQIGGVAANLTPRFGEGATLDSINQVPSISNVIAWAGDKSGFTKGSQDLYDTFAELDGMATSIAVAQARANGQVGIDRDTEVLRIRKSAPVVDFSRDPETVRSQLNNLAQWVKTQNNNLRPAQTQQTSAPSQGANSAPASTGQFQTRSGLSYTVSQN